MEGSFKQTSLLSKIWLKHIFYRTFTFNYIAGGRFGPGVYHSNYAAKCIINAESKDVDDDSLFFFIIKVLITESNITCSSLVFFHKYLFKKSIVLNIFWKNPTLFFIRTLYNNNLSYFLVLYTSINTVFYI